MLDYYFLQGCIFCISNIVSFFIFKSVFLVENAEQNFKKEKKRKTSTFKTGLPIMTGVVGFVAEVLWKEPVTTCV